MSLVEIMVALVIGIFLIGGIIQVLASSRAASRLADAQARTQENGRYASQYLAREMRPSRSPACRNIAHEEIDGPLNVLAFRLLTSGGSAAIGTKTPLGYSELEGKIALDDLPAEAQTKVEAHWLRGDVLVSWGASGEGFYTTANDLAKAKSPDDIQTALKDPITLVAATDQLTGGGLAMITDCEKSDIFEITNEEGSDLTNLEHDASGNKDARLQSLYSQKGSPSVPGGTIRARVFPFDFRVYFVCCVGKQNGKLQPDDEKGTVAHCTTDPENYRPALCRWSARADDTQAVVMDVADMRVTYDGRSGQTRFSETASAVSTGNRWDQVYSARVALLATCGDEARIKAESPSLAAPGSTLGQGLDADRRIYGSFDTTIAIRSRAPWFASP